MKTRTRVTPLVILTHLAITAGTLPAIAQETRADAIRQEQIDRQSAVRPPETNAVEKLVDRLDRWGYISGTPRGVHPRFGSVFPGGGFAAGAGVRKPFGDDGTLNVLAGYSISGYSRAQADLGLPAFANSRARLTLSGRYIDANDVAYYGPGNESSKDNRVSYAYTPSSGSARLDVDVTNRLEVGGGVAYLDISTSAGRTAPSIEQHPAAADIPGLGATQHGFLNSTARVVYDWRRPLGYSGSGGMYRVQVDDLRDRANDRHSFRSFEAEAIQLIPVLRANWVVALRGVATVTDTEAGQEVPFFLAPSIGGGSSLRGYPDFRFRDRNRMVINAELRWTPARFLDMALFYDAGKVTARRQDLDFDQLKNSYGIGMRVIGPGGYALRLEAAHSREHRARLIVSAGGGF